MKKIKWLLCLAFLLIIKIPAFAQTDQCSNSERALVNIRPEGLTEISALKMIRGQKEFAILGDSTRNLPVSVFPPMARVRHYQTKVLFTRKPELLDSYWSVDPHYISYEENTSIDWPLIITWIIVLVVGMLGSAILLEGFFILDPDEKPKAHFLAGTICSIFLGCVALIFYGINIVRPDNLTWGHLTTIISFMYAGYLILSKPFHRGVIVCIEYIDHLYMKTKLKLNVRKN